MIRRRWVYVDCRACRGTGADGECDACSGQGATVEARALVVRRATGKNNKIERDDL